MKQKKYEGKSNEYVIRTIPNSFADIFMNKAYEKLKEMEGTDVCRKQEEKWYSISIVRAL